MRWKNGWPVIGMDADGDGRGEPVLSYRKPDLPRQPPSAPVADDAFDGPASLAWQFGSNPGEDWMSVGQGRLRLKAVTGSADFYENGAILSQKLPGSAFCATTRMTFAPLRVGERAGLTVHGTDFAWIGLEKTDGGVRLVHAQRSDGAPGAPIIETTGPLVTQDALSLRLCAQPVIRNVPPPDFTPYWPSMLRDMRMAVRFSYSLNDADFTELGGVFEARPGRWVGAQIGLFAQARLGTPAAVATSVGHADFDWFRIGK
jgi:beta-xylosidase